MSGSLTVIGGHSNAQGLTGLVTTPSGLTGPIVTTLQSLLTAASGAVSTGSANFENLNVAGLSGPQNVTVGGFSTGVLDISNTNSVNGTTSGAASASLAVPGGYNTLVVQAPGSETISGNGASNFLGVFGAQSTVHYYTGGGSGSIFAGAAGDYVGAEGSAWSIYGAASGGDQIGAIARSAYISVSGAAQNVVGLGDPNATVASSGAQDLIQTYAGADVVTMSGGGNVIVDGGVDTVYAAPGNTGVTAFFDDFGGTLVFINNSSTPATVHGGLPGATGGSATVSGGAGGGYFVGGQAGDNSLVGGTGLVTLYGAGTNNYLSASGNGTNGAANALFAGSGTATLVATASTFDNQFSGGTGSSTMTSFGAGAQTFFVGSTGQEQMTGATVSGASNNYYFLQDSTGNGSDIITNFTLGRDHLYVNVIGPYSGVSISGVEPLGGGVSGSIVYLSDKTTIQLYGVSAASIQSVVGGSQI